MINITDVRLKILDNKPESKVRANGSITIDESFVVHDVRVIDSEKGLYVAMPSKKSADNEFRDIAHPINTETRNMIQEAVLAKYNEKLEEEQS